jgi:hypothetical protein
MGSDRENGGHPFNMGSRLRSGRVDMAEFLAQERKSKTFSEFWKVLCNIEA